MAKRTYLFFLTFVLRIKKKKKKEKKSASTEETDMIWKNLRKTLYAPKTKKKGRAYSL